MADTGQSKVVQKIHEVTGVRLFTPPPEGFDPVEASDRELLVHGFPARPDVQIHSELNEYWHQMMRQPMSIIQPQFGVMPDWGHALRQAAAPTAPTAGDGWSGSAVQLSVDVEDAFTFVAGQWTVPNIIDPAPGQNAICGCAEWVGIDGYNELSPDILQAGTTQAIYSFPFGPMHATWAWFEWYPHDSFLITNFPVSPGDVMVCVICVHSSTEAGVYMKNLTTGVYTSLTKTAPDGVHLVGNTAEWILESPVNGDLGPLAKYGEVYFDYCIAGTRNALYLGGQAYPVGHAIPLQMHDVNAKPISKPEFVTGRLITTKYTA